MSGSSSLKRRRTDLVHNEEERLSTLSPMSLSATDPPFSFFSPLQSLEKENRVVNIAANATSRSQNNSEHIIQSPAVQVPQRLNDNPHVMIEVDQDWYEKAIKPPSDMEGMCCSYSCRNLVKSELVTTLDSQRREIDELRDNLSKSQKKLFSAERERESLSVIAKKLDSAMASEQGKLASLQTQLTDDTEHSGSLLRRQMARSDELRVELGKESRLRKEAEARADVAEREAQDAQLELEKLKVQASNDYLRAQAESERALGGEQQVVSRLKHELQLARGNAEAGGKEVSALEEQIRDCQLALQAAESGRASLEAELAAALLAAANQNMTGGITAGLEGVVRDLRQEVGRQSAELASLRLLSQRAHQLPLVEEQLRAEQKRAEEGVRQLADLQKLLEEAQGAQREVDRWHDTIGSIPGLKAREDIPSVFGDLQRQVASSLANQSKLNLQIVQLSTSLEAAESARAQTERDATSAKDRAAELANSLARAERKLSMVAQERDGLKDLLATYDMEADLAIGLPAGQSDSADKTKDLRIQELESTLASCQSALANQEEALQRQGQLAGEARVDLDRSREEIGKLRGQLAAAEWAAEQLRKEASLVQSKEEAQPPSNLGAEEELKRQLAEARERLQQVEGSRAATSASGEASSADVDVLRRRIGSLEKKEARLKEIFEQKILSFREACFCLLGYRLDLVQDTANGELTPGVVLRSSFADSEEQFLKFRQAGRGRYELLPSEYVAAPQIQRMVEVFVDRFGSIPAFTANLSIELFNQQTMTM